MTEAFIDPHGVPDVFCNDLGFVHLAAPGVVRFGLFAFEDNHKVLRTKILLPTTVIAGAVKRVTAFMAVQMYDRLITTERPEMLM